jgi:hypothetical protein
VGSDVKANVTFLHYEGPLHHKYIPGGQSVNRTFDSGGLVHLDNSVRIIAKKYFENGTWHYRDNTHSQLALFYM